VPQQPARQGCVEGGPIDPGRCRACVALTAKVRDSGEGDAPGEGGFLILAEEKGTLLGALLMLNTGMTGFVPPNILLFVTVHPDHRGRGLGRKIIDHSVAQCDGDVKLHVEYDNPAKRLYERVGFTTKYAEMRLSR